MTPTAYISIDINPSLELGINRFDRIVSVEGYMIWPSLWISHL